MSGEGERLCVITGVGPGTGSALVRRFVAGGYRVAALARNAARLQALADGVPGVSVWPCDVSDAEALRFCCARITEQFGVPNTVIHNAVGGGWGDVLEIDRRMLELNFQVNTLALLELAQGFAPAMVERGSGCILVTGNTSAYRGRANFAGFAPTKAAQRVLAESMARRLGPDGVHVAYVAVDAVIDVPWTREVFTEAPDTFFCQPTDIADECFHIAHQPRSAWTFDVQIRPSGETW